MGELNKTAQTNDPNGEALFDHRVAVQPHFLPPDAQESHDFFQHHFVNASPRKEATQDLDGVMVPGVTPKSFVRLGVGKDEDGRRGTDRAYMLKPFFESNEWWPHSFYPTAGFAELANQSMYHAAGIGHLHHIVHAFHHTDGAGATHPMLAVEFHPDAEDLTNAILPDGWTDENLDHAAKIGIMDYLTNNQDRHGANLMVYGEAEPQLLAIDHGRSFQYRHGQRHAENQGSDYQDHPFWYLGYGGSPAMRFFEPKESRSRKPEDRTLPLLEPARVNQTLGWFQANEGKMRDALEQHLAHFHDQDAASWIRQNFNDRCAVLHKWSDLWQDNDDYKSYVPGEYAENEAHLHPLSLPIVPNSHGEQFVHVPSTSDSIEA